MTTPGNPLTTLKTALDNYVIAQTAMKDAAASLAADHTATAPPPITVTGNSNGPVSP